MPGDQPLIDVGAGQTVTFASPGDAYAEFVAFLSGPTIRRHGGHLRIRRPAAAHWSASPRALRRHLQVAEAAPLVLVATGGDGQNPLDDLAPRLVAIGAGDDGLRYRPIDADHPAVVCDCYTPKLLAALVAGQTRPRDTQVIVTLARQDARRFRREWLALVRACVLSPDRREHYRDVLDRGRISAVEVAELLDGYLTGADLARRRGQHRFLRYVLATLTPDRYPVLADAA